MIARVRRQAEVLVDRGLGQVRGTLHGEDLPGVVRALGCTSVGPANASRNHSRAAGENRSRTAGMANISLDRTAG